MSEMRSLNQGVYEKGMEKGQLNEFERSVRSMRKAGLDNARIATLLEKGLAGYSECEIVILYSMPNGPGRFPWVFFVVCSGSSDGRYHERVLWLRGTLFPQPILGKMIQYPSPCLPGKGSPLFSIRETPDS